MSFLSRVEAFLGGLKKTDKQRGEEIKKPYQIKLFDLRDAAKAEERKVEPGFYFAVYPIKEPQ